MNGFYDKQGKPITIEQWNRLLENDEYRILRQSFVGSIIINTIWTGIDVGSDDAPLIFETGILDPREAHGRVAGRYSTEEDALQDHEWAVQSVRMEVTRYVRQGDLTPYWPPETPVTTGDLIRRCRIYADGIFIRIGKDDRPLSELPLGQALEWIELWVRQGMLPTIFRHDHYPERPSDDASGKKGEVDSGG